MWLSKGHSYILWLSKQRYDINLRSKLLKKLHLKIREIKCLIVEETSPSYTSPGGGSSFSKMSVYNLVKLAYTNVGNDQ